MLRGDRKNGASVCDGEGGRQDKQMLPVTENGKKVRMIRERAMKRTGRTHMQPVLFSDIISAAGRKDVIVFLFAAFFIVFLMIRCYKTEAAEIQIISLEEGVISDATEQVSGDALPLVPAAPPSNLVYGDWENMGELEIAAYCSCQECVGVSEGYRTYSGAEPVEGVTVAADLAMFPIGTRIKLGDNGIEYVVEDKISSDGKEKVSIYFKNHEDAIRFGRQRLQVSRQIVIDETGPGERLGVFNVTGYCGCDQCTAGGGVTYLGTQPRSGHTVAVDPSVIPLGSVVYINGVSYTAEDTGRKVQENSVDIYFDSHEEAVKYGKQEHVVYIINKSE